MPDTSFLNLFIVCLVAAGAPLLLGFFPRLRLPSVILEIALSVALALALASAWLLERSRFGRALRAVADDSEGARVVGVPVDLLVGIAFGLVGALAMIAAIAAAPGEAVNANTGTLLGLKGLVAALAVRFGPPLRAFAAGLVLGVVEAAIANVHLGSWQLGPSYREVLPIALVLLLIAAWPSREALEERE